MARALFCYSTNYTYSSHQGWVGFFGFHDGLNATVDSTKAVVVEILRAVQMRDEASSVNFPNVN
jgi:hypothetical protein